MATSTKQSKRVSWAADASLCQVRLFLSEDAPSLSSLGFQDHLQTKTSWLWHSTAVDSDDSLPPGFEGRPIKDVRNEISDIPTIKWQYPCRLNLNIAWLVVAGEESEELVLQNQRQRGVLEAIYPRTSSIPPNPFFPLETAKPDHEDDDMLLVPVTAVEEDEEEEEEFDPPCAISMPPHTSTSGPPSTVRNLTNLPMPPNLPNFEFAYAPQLDNTATPMLPCSSLKPAISGSMPGVEPDIAAAASAALAAIARSNDNSSMIDHELLIKIFSDPKMIEKLVSEYGTSKHPSPLQPAVPLLSSASPQPQPVQISGTTTLSSTLLQHPYHNPIVAVSFPLNHRPVPLTAKPTTISTIQQHVGDNQDTHCPVPLHSIDNEGYRQIDTIGNDLNGGVRPMRKRDYREKIAKPCVYFSTPRGCKHGANCLYVHDASLAQKVERRGGKRVKFDGEFL